MTTEAEVKERIFSFAGKSISLLEFENWVISQVRKELDAAAADLIAEAELALSEYSSNHLDDLELRTRLLEASGHFIVDAQLDDEVKVAPRLRLLTTRANSVRTVFVQVAA